MGHERASATRETRKRGEIPGIYREIIDPQYFIAGNFAVNVLNESRFANMQGVNFNPKLYYSDPIQVIRVVDHDPRNEKGFYYTLYDGHHRLRGAESFQKYLKELEGTTGDLPKKYLEYLAMLEERGDTELLPQSRYDYVLHVNDITDELIYKYDPSIEQHPGERHFTPAQAIIEVIRPTQQHEELAAHRIAAHVLTDWNRMFRQDRKGDYSAMAALCYLGIDELRDKQPRATADYLGRPDIELVVDETTERRSAISQGLMDLAEIIRETTRGYEAITLNAFQTVSQIDDTPEGIALKQSQTNGLLTLPEVRRKIDTDSPGDSVLSDRFAQVSGLLLQVLPQAARDFRENRTFRQAVLDQNLTYDDLISVLQPPDDDYTPTSKEDRRLLSTRYAIKKFEINMRHVLEIYARLNEGTAPPEKELAFLRVSCNSDRIETDDRLAALIQRAKVMTTRTPKSRPAGRDRGQQEREPQEQQEPRNPGEIVIASAGDLTAALEGFSQERPLEARAEAAVMGVVGQARRLGLVPDEEPPEDKEPEPLTDLAMAQQVLLFLARTDISADALPILDQIKEKYGLKAGVDWSRITLRPEVGRNRWFERKFILGRTELSQDDRQQVTLRIDNIAKSHLTELGPAWESISGIIRDREGRTGLDAIDASFSNRLGYLASQVHWDISSDEFRYLCANHYRLSLQSYIQDERAKGGKFEMGRFRSLQDLEGLQGSFGDDLKVAIRGVPARDIDAYKVLLQYAVYSPIGSQQYKDVVGFLRRNSFSSGVAERLRATKEQSGQEEVLDLFNEAIVKSPEK